VAGTAPADYKDPEKFFSRTYFTRALREHAGMVLRRLSGEIKMNDKKFLLSVRRRELKITPPTECQPTFERLWHSSEKAPYVRSAVLRRRVADNVQL